VADNFERKYHALLEILEFMALLMDTYERGDIDKTTFFLRAHDFRRMVDNEVLKGE